MPNLTIKPVAGGSNKLILQDQQGGTVLETGGSGATIANASLTAPTIANMANCTFPSTHPNITITKLDWAGDTTGTTETVVATYHGWQNTKASSTVWVEMTFNAEAKVDGGASSLRYGRWIMYYSTSSVSDGATSSFGTELSRGTMGRTTATTTSNGNASHATMTLTGTFTSSSSIGTQYYVGLTSDADGTHTRLETHSAFGMGTIIKILEY